MENVEIKIKCPKPGLMCYVAFVDGSGKTMEFGKPILFDQTPVSEETLKSILNNLGIVIGKMAGTIVSRVKEDLDNIVES